MAVVSFKTRACFLNHANTCSAAEEWIPLKTSGETRDVVWIAGTASLNSGPSHQGAPLVLAEKGGRGLGDGLGASEALLAEGLLRVLKELRKLRL